ncbi:MAG: hypothetical protein JO102_00340 [Elusimicrobia bacterium]|nr:hypothetical protein [Elusimicrobiota bacterium]
MKLLKRLILSALTYRQAEAVKTAVCAFLYYSGLAHLWSLIRPGGPPS